MSQTIEQETTTQAMQKLKRCKQIVQRDLKRYHPELLKAIFTAKKIVHLLDICEREIVKVTYEYKGQERVLIRSEKVFSYALSEYKKKHPEIIKHCIKCNDDVMNAGYSCLLKEKIRTKGYCQSCIDDMEDKFIMQRTCWRAGFDPELIGY